MRRFWKDARATRGEGGWQVMLDGRAVKTQGGNAQLVPSAALAEALASEWAAQGEEIDPQGFALRDLADLAIDVIAPDRDGAVAQLLRYAETDTLCYRAEPDEPLFARQQEVWEPLLAQAEARWDVRFVRISGVIHHPQSQDALARLGSALNAKDDYTLAALTTLAALSASLVVALAAIEPDADAEALWNASELEEHWQVEQWGEDHEAAQRRARRFAAFAGAIRFAALARQG